MFCFCFFNCWDYFHHTYLIKPQVTPISIPLNWNVEGYPLGSLPCGHISPIKPSRKTFLTIKQGTETICCSYWGFHRHCMTYFAHEYFSQNSDNPKQQGQNLVHLQYVTNHWFDIINLRIYHLNISMINTSGHVGSKVLITIIRNVVIWSWSCLCLLLGWSVNRNQGVATDPESINSSASTFPKSQICKNTLTQVKQAAVIRLNRTKTSQYTYFQSMPITCQRFSFYH